MQTKLKYLAFVTTLLLSFTTAAQVTEVCDSTELVLSVNDEVWGDQIWQYSEDALNWEIFDYLTNETITISTDNDGFYRLLVVDGDCDTTYVSDIQEILVHESEGSVSQEFSCGEFILNDITYTQSGTYMLDTLVNQLGCDSIVSMELIVGNPSSSEVSIAACDSYFWNGTEYNESGEYEFLLENSEGCDSLAYLDLTVEESTLGLTLNSVFDNGLIPSSEDPFFWISGDSSITDVSFHINDEIISSEELFYSIPNPQVSFEIYASAYHPELGCVVSDTSSYEVYDSSTNAMGFFDISGNFDLNSIVVSSTIDSVPLNGLQDFDIDYLSIAELDILYSYSLEFALDSELVAVTVVPFGTDSITISNETSAAALVLLDPSVSGSLWTDYSGLLEEVRAHENFPDLVQAIDDQIVLNGYLDIGDQTLIEYISLLTGDITSGFHGGSEERFLTGLHPIFTTTPSGKLNYHHNDIRHFHVTRIYEGSTPVSEPIVLAGNQNSLSSQMARVLMNILASDTDPLYQDVVALPVRTNGEVTRADVNSQSSFAHLRSRLVNGLYPELQALDNASEEARLAKELNSLYMGVNLILSVPGLSGRLVTGPPGEAASLFSNSASVYNNIWLSSHSPEQVANLTAGLGGFLSESRVWAARFTNASIVLALYEISALTAESFLLLDDFYYAHSMLGDKLTDRVFTSFQNSAGQNTDSLLGVPGSWTTTSSTLSLKTQTRNYRYFHIDLADNPDNLHWQSEEENFNLLDGVTFSGVFFESDETILINGTEQIALEYEFSGHPIAIGPNEFKWRLSWDAAVGLYAILGIRINLLDQDITTPLTGSPNINIVAEVEMPMLEIFAGDNQSGYPNELLDDPCVVVPKTTSGIELPDGYPVHFEIVDGDGFLSNQLYPGEAALQEVETLNGSSAIVWRLGNDGEQSMKAAIVHPQTEAEFVSVEFTATIQEYELHIIDAPDIIDGLCTEWASGPIRVQVSGASTDEFFDDIPIRWEVLEGGGYINFAPPNPFGTNSYTYLDVPTYSLGMLEGISEVYWVRGNPNEQVLRASIMNADNTEIIASQEFTMSGTPSCPLDLSGLYGDWTVALYDAETSSWNEDSYELTIQEDGYAIYTTSSGITYQTSFEIVNIGEHCMYRESGSFWSNWYVHTLEDPCFPNSTLTEPIESFVTWIYISCCMDNPEPQIRYTKVE